MVDGLHVYNGLDTINGARNIGQVRRILIHFIFPFFLSTPCFAEPPPVTQAKLDAFRELKPKLDYENKRVDRLMYKDFKGVMSDIDRKAVNSIAKIKVNHIYRSGDTRRRHESAGTAFLVDPLHMVSAAHCIYRTTPNNKRIFIPFEDIEIEFPDGTRRKIVKTRFDSTTRFRPDIDGYEVGYDTVAFRLNKAVNHLAPLKTMSFEDVAEKYSIERIERQWCMVAGYSWLPTRIDTKKPYRAEYDIKRSSAFDSLSYDYDCFIRRKDVKSDGIFWVDNCSAHTGASGAPLLIDHTQKHDDILQERYVVGVLTLVGRKDPIASFVRWEIFHKNYMELKNDP